MARRNKKEESNNLEEEKEPKKEIRYAAVSDRLFAMGLDLGMLYFLVVPLSALLFPLFMPEGDIAMQAYELAVKNQPELANQQQLIMEYIIREHPEIFDAIMQQFFVKSVIQIFIVAAVIVPLTFYKGATLGKMILGLKVVDSITYQRISPMQSIIRFIGYALFIGMIWAAFNRRGRAWHDYLADSVVIIDENRWYKRIWDKIIGKK